MQPQYDGISGNGIFIHESQPMAVNVVRFFGGSTTTRHLLVTNMTTVEEVNRIKLHGNGYITGFVFNGGFVSHGFGFSDVNRYVLWELPNVMKCKNEAEMWSKSIETRLVVSRCAMNKTMVVSWSLDDRHISVDDFWIDRELALENNSDGREAEEGNEMPSQTVEDGREGRDDAQEVPGKKRKLN